METFQDYAYYYNLIYSDKDYAKEAETVRRIIGRHQAAPVKKVLDIGCGTGKHDVCLHKLGYQVKGIDLSTQMVEIARQNAEGIDGLEFEVGNAQEYKTDIKYDAVLSLFHVMSYQNDNEQILAAFQTAHDALVGGGIFLFDTWYGPGVLTDRPAVRVKRVEDDRVSVVRYASPVMEPNRNIVNVNYDILVIDKTDRTVREIKEEHRMRYFFLPEITFFLQCSGFELLECLDECTLGETGFESWTSYFVARRK